ncbi:hypothetical protein OTK49_21170 [Vibrio coralliirubri]|uniref:hypothetical protein n=1 Tax=Vibrio coralliirubri TaxID=1516159 RepID=UPI00228383A2|nr:hypothetical protein [Vibrio coralliirubri]MCY9865032.1 hypothetical protein [Vibrio coralliirubri]
MPNKFKYTLANCNKNSIMKTMGCLSEMISDELKASIKADTLALRFMACESYVDVHPKTVDVLPFNETVIDSLEVFGTFFRGNLNVNELEYDYLKGICFTVANKLKSDGVVKVSGSKLLALLCSAMGYKSHQAFKSVAEKSQVQPEFKTYRFDDMGQDFYEFVTLDGLIVDCQPHQASVWCGMRGSLMPLSDQFIINFGKYNKPVEFNTLGYFDQSTTMNYSAEVDDTPIEYQKGFLSFLAGDAAPVRDVVSADFAMGYNVAKWNTNQDPAFLELFKAE